MDRFKAVIDYTNWRGVRGTRVIVPQRLFFGVTEHHPVPQWLLDARDLDKGEMRTFALKDIHNPESVNMRFY